MKAKMKKGKHKHFSLYIRFGGPFSCPSNRKTSILARRLGVHRGLGQDHAIDPEPRAQHPGNLIHVGAQAVVRLGGGLALAQELGVFIHGALHETIQVFIHQRIIFPVNIPKHIVQKILIHKWGLVL